MNLLTFTALAAGLMAGAVEFAFVRGMGPFLADFGIQVGGLLVLLWLVLAILALRRHGRRAWPALLPLPAALFAPTMIAAIFAACALDSSQCP